MKNKIEIIIFRILFFIPVITLMIVSLMITLMRWFKNYIKYGFEFIGYDEITNKKSIANVFHKVKLLQVETPGKGMLIKTVRDLQGLSSEHSADCFVLLNGGIRSFKTIFYDYKTETFEITNQIDDSIQYLTSDELYTKSSIGEAIDKGALYTDV